MRSWPVWGSRPYFFFPFGLHMVLRVNDLAVRPKLDGITFELRRGEVLGLAGLLGSGRTELLRAIAGLAPLDRGAVEIKMPATTSDVVMTPDLRFTARGDGTLNLELRVSDAGLRQVAASRQIQQCVVRDAAPQKEGKARGQLQIRQPMDLA